jgi:hypothetical protein
MKQTMVLKSLTIATIQKGLEVIGNVTINYKL